MLISFGGYILRPTRGRTSRYIHGRTSSAHEVKEHSTIGWHALSPWLTIGELSTRSGVATSALRYYEQIGLIASRRTPGNQRRYARHMLRRVSLADVQSALSTVPLDRTPSQADWQRASEQWRATLEQRRHAIERLERELTGCIGCGCLSMRSCALLNPDDALGSHGPGPHRLKAEDEPHTHQHGPE